MDIGVVYHIETPQQFWTEVDDILNVNQTTPLSGIDYSLKAFVVVCANNHERFLQTNAQLGHACELLLDTELFGMHSQRSMDSVLADAKTSLDPHVQLILYEILLRYGGRHPSFFRNLRKWSPLVPFLMDHIMVDIDDSVALTYGMSGSGGVMGLGLPIEMRLRTISVTLLYEICRVQKIDAADLKLFTDDFINRLFDLVEDTRNNPDDNVNYSLIKLLVALNEQFMVASLPPPVTQKHHLKGHPPRSPATPPPGQSHTKSEADSTSEQQSQNRVLAVLVRRLNLSKTFGESLIFMLNRADNTPEDLCMQLLVLKLLYLLFTTPGTEEYFYTNDLRVLVDVFIRELLDLPDESESLRHTYLRVLHPLLSNTQLRTHPYKRHQIRNVLQSLIAHAHIRDVTHTTRRLVDRCLRGSWCKSLDTELQLKPCPPETIASGAISLTNSEIDIKASAPIRTIHKSASINFTKGGSGQLDRRPSKSGIHAVPDVPPLPRSAEPNVITHPIPFHRSSELSGSSEEDAMPRQPSHQSSGDSMDAPNRPSVLAFTTPASIVITSVTPTDETRPPLEHRPRSSSNAEQPRRLRDKSLPPPPRPPPLRKRPDGRASATEREAPTRNDSLGEVALGGFDIERRPASPAISPDTQSLRADSPGLSIRRSAPPTPPPRRRPAPAVPTGLRKVSGSATMVSNNGNTSLGVPVARWAVSS